MQSAKNKILAILGQLYIDICASDHSEVTEAQDKAAEKILKIIKCKKK